MLNLKSVFGVVLAALALVGCGDKISDQALQATGLKGAPKWVIYGGGLYSSVGDAPIVQGNVQFARTEALAQARAGVAKQIEVKINSYLQKSATRKDVTLAEEVQNQIGEMAKVDLVDSNPAKFWINDDGSRVYVLIEISEQTVEKIREKLKEQKIDAAQLEEASRVR